MATKEVIAKALKNYRFSREMTLQEIADATGLNVATIHRLEKAKSNPHELTVEILKRKLPGLFATVRQSAATDCRTESC